jgi:hypothetical protein
MLVTMATGSDPRGEARVCLEWRNAMIGRSDVSFPPAIVFLFTFRGAIAGHHRVFGLLPVIVRGLHLCLRCRVTSCLLRDRLRWGHGAY